MSSLRYKLWPMRRSLLSTVDAAAAAGVPRATLQERIRRGRIKAPAVQHVGKMAARFWTPAHVQQIRDMKGTLKSGPKGNPKRAKSRTPVTKGRVG